MALEKITTAYTTGFGEVGSILANKGRLYVAKGAITDAEITALTANKEALKGAVEGDNAVFLPLGSMAEDCGTFEAKPKSFKIDFGTVLTGYENTLTLNSVMLDASSLAFLDSDEARGCLSVLFIPQGSDVIVDKIKGDLSKFICFSDLLLVPEMSLNFKGDPSTVKLVFTGETKKITDVLKIKTGITASA